MPILSYPSDAPRTALYYITAGALIDVWTAIYWMYTRTQYQKDPTTVSDTTWFWIYGFFLTGLTLLIIGLTLGQIGRNARKSELPPAEVTHDAAVAEQAAAAQGAPPVPVQPVQPAAPAQPAGAGH